MLEKSKSGADIIHVEAGGSAGNRLALDAGKRGRSNIASTSLDVWSEGGEPSPGAGGRWGGEGVLARWWLWPIE